SHNMDAVQRLCTRGMLLDHGRLIATGPIGDVVSQYRSFERRIVDTGRFNPRARMGTGWARIKDIVLMDESGLPVPTRPADADLVFEVSIAMDGDGHAGGSLRGL